MGLDAQTLRRALYDFFRFNPKDFFLQAAGSGYLVSATPRKSVGQNAFPFQLLNASDGGGLKIRVRYGLLQGIAPDGMSYGDDPPYIVDAGGTHGVVFLSVTLDEDFVITSRTIGVDATLPANDLDTRTFYWEIGSYSTTGGVLTIAQGISGSQAFELCGGVEPLWGLT